MGWGRNSLGKQRDEGRPSSANRVVVVMVLLVDLTHTRPSSLQQLPTCLSFSLHLGPSKKSFTDESGEQQQYHGQVGSMAAAEKRRERREREREREKEEYYCGSTYCAVPAPLSSFTARAFWWGACHRAHLKWGRTLE